MDIEKLIEQLRKSADFEDYPIVASFAAIIEKKYLRDAATALSTFRAENEKLRAELEHWKNAHHDAARNFQAENQICRRSSAELEQKLKLIAQQAAELERRDKLLKEQETELERVKAEKAKAIENLSDNLRTAYQSRDAAVDDLETIMFVGGQNTDTCMYCKNARCYDRGGSQLCSPQWRGPRKEN